VAKRLVRTHAISRRRENQVATYRPSSVRPGSRRHGQVRCWVRPFGGQAAGLAITARSGCPSADVYRNLDCSCCPCQRRLYYADGKRASGPPRAGLFEYDYKLKAASLLIKPARWPTLASPPSWLAYEHPKRKEVLIEPDSESGDGLITGLQVGQPIKEVMQHQVPRRNASWAYVFGRRSSLNGDDFLQFVTGICLAFVYVPLAGQA